MTNRIVHTITPNSSLIDHWGRARESRKQLRKDIREYFNSINMPETYKLVINSMGTYIPDIIAVVYDTNNTEVGQVVAGGNTYNSYSQVKGKVKYMVVSTRSYNNSRVTMCECEGMGRINGEYIGKIPVVEVNDDRYALQVIADNFKPIKHSSKANVRVMKASGLDTGKQAIRDDIQQLQEKIKFYEQILGVHINREVIEESVTNS